MPMYEYVCTSCAHEFEELARSVTGRDRQRCPSCDSTAVQRKLSVFAARQGAAKPADRPVGGPCGQCCNPDGSCPL